jgi:hypothetical protein
MPQVADLTRFKRRSGKPPKTEIELILQLKNQYFSKTKEERKII